MRLILPLAGVLLPLGLAAAQAPKPERLLIGSTFGYGRSTLRLGDLRVQAIGGVYFGFLVHAHLGAPFAMQPELIFTRRGGQELATRRDSTVRVLLEQVYLDFPLLASLELPFPAGRVRPHVYAGFAPAIRLGCDVQVVAGSPQEPPACSDQDFERMRGVDFGVAYGGGVDVRFPRITLRGDLRWTRGYVAAYRSGANQALNRQRIITLGFAF